VTRQERRRLAREKASGRVPVLVKDFDGSTMIVTPRAAPAAIAPRRDRRAVMTALAMLASAAGRP
jgi:hypothetical protein